MLANPNQIFMTKKLKVSDDELITLKGSSIIRRSWEGVVVFVTTELNQ
jgi:hypothetical protein